MAPVQMFTVTLVVIHEGRHLGDGGGRVGRGAHGAVVLSPLTPLGLVLHPLPLQSRLDLEDKDKWRILYGAGNKNRSGPSSIHHQCCKASLSENISGPTGLYANANLKVGALLVLTNLTISDEVIIPNFSVK